MTSRRRVWSNWSGSVRCTPASVETPDGLEAVVQVVRRARRDRRRMRVAGSGHSFCALVATDDVLVSTEAMRGIESIDRARGEVTVRAGTRLRELGRELHAAGLALENLGGVDVQTAAGAISTGTHGTGLGFGSMSTQVTGLTLVAADGSVMECTADKNPDIFEAGRLSLGAIGVIVSLTLRVVPSRLLRINTKREPIADCRERLAEHAMAHERFELFWFPHTSWALARSVDPDRDATRPANRQRRQVTDLVLENGLLWAMAEACRHRPALAPRVSAFGAGHAPVVRAVDWTHRALVSPRMVRMEATEYAIPLENGSQALAEIEAALARHNYPVFVPLGCRVVRGDDIWLSPSYGRDSVYIAAHAYRGMPYEPYFREVESILQAHGGRPHWGKWHSCGPDELARLYPRWDDFQKVRRTVDPDGLFVNDYLQQLLEADPYIQRSRRL